VDKQVDPDQLCISMLVGITQKQILIVRIEKRNTAARCFLGVFYKHSRQASIVLSLPSSLPSPDFAQTGPEFYQ